jgi:hypothetical protein
MMLYKKARQPPDERELYRERIAREQRLISDLRGEPDRRAA